ncbi:MAG: dihydroneopterin aldolase [Cyanobacteria bacterium P01_A01_bin.84]
MDCIRLTGIRAYGYTGFLTEEQVLGQWFEVDVNLWLDISKASQSDDIEDTLDYRKVIDTVKKLIKTSKFALIEKLAATIAEAILEDDSSVLSPEKVQVILSKPSAPIPDFGGKISIEITRIK